MSCKFEFVNFIFENCWRLLITIGLHRIVSGGHIVSGCPCYASKHKNHNGYDGAAHKRPIIEDQLIAKQINFCSKQSFKFSLNLITNVIAWLWNNQFGLYYQIMIDYWLFDECARGTHCRKIMCDELQDPNTMGRFSLILEMGFRWNSFGHFGKCLICTTCLVRNMSEMV